MHAGVWDKSAKGAHEVRGRTLGIVGYGNIGSQLSVIAESARHAGLLLRRRRQARPGQRPPLRQRSTSCSRWPRRSPCTWTAGPGTPDCSAPSSSPRCGRGSLFLNLCRGIVVDHDALRDHLLSGHIAGAALDVFADGAEDGR